MRNHESTVESPGLRRSSRPHAQPRSAILSVGTRVAIASLLLPRSAFAIDPHLEDKIADVIVWVVLVAAPVIAIGVFLLVHILPEKIAEKRHHPQLDAIKTLCLLSLFFGGLLWPLAWLWAYTKPVLHKMAYGTDTSEAHEPTELVTTAARPVESAVSTPITVEPAMAAVRASDRDSEIRRLRQRLLELETKATSGPST
jgi:CBS domain containing-hemolysin-like protein